MGLPSVHANFGSHTPFLIDRCRCGRSCGERIALWLVGRAPDTSIAARTLVPSEPEVTVKPSEVTSAKVPSPEQRELRQSAPTQAKTETADMGADRERASPDRSKISPNPSLLQRHIGSAEEHETTPSRNLNVSTARAEGVQRRETSRNSPQRLNHTNPALAGSKSLLNVDHPRGNSSRGDQIPETNERPICQRSFSRGGTPSPHASGVAIRDETTAGPVHAIRELRGDHLHATTSFAFGSRYSRCDAFIVRRSSSTSEVRTGTHRKRQKGLIRLMDRWSKLLVSRLMASRLSLK